MNNSVFTTNDIVKYLIISSVIIIILKVIFDKPKNVKQPTIKTEESKSTEEFIAMTKAGRDAEALRVLTSPIVDWWNKRKAKK
jgi:hypothetical protein